MNATNRESWCRWRVLCIFITLNWLHFFVVLLCTVFSVRCWWWLRALLTVTLCFPINYTIIITITWGDLVNCKDKSIIILTHFFSLHQSKFTFPWSRKDILFFSVFESEWMMVIQYEWTKLKRSMDRMQDERKLLTVWHFVCCSLYKQKFTGVLQLEFTVFYLIHFQCNFNLNFYIHSGKHSH